MPHHRAYRSSRTLLHHLIIPLVLLLLWQAESIRLKFLLHADNLFQMLVSLMKPLILPIRHLIALKILSGWPGIWLKAIEIIFGRKQRGFCDFPSIFENDGVVRSQLLGVVGGDIPCVHVFVDLATLISQDVPITTLAIGMVEVCWGLHTLRHHAPRVDFVIADLNSCGWRTSELHVCAAETSVEHWDVSVTTASIRIVERELGIICTPQTVAIVVSNWHYFYY